MGIPVNFLTKFAIPLIIAAFTLEGNGPDQAALFATSLKESDRVLSLINKDGDGGTEFYDYIIVGAGSAGSVLAKRLTEDGTHSVLILEAGGDPTPISKIPWLANAHTDDSNVGMVFNYQTVPQENACLGRNGFCEIKRGKALGGSSSITGLLYNRCNPKDYDLWANFTGDPIWGWNSVLEAFKGIETYDGLYSHEASPNHGTRGEMNIGTFTCPPVCEIFEKMLAEYEIPVGDLNSGKFHSGFSRVDADIKNGLRGGTYNGFLEPIIGVRKNLKVYRYAWVTKIHLDEEKKAVGVTYWRHGEIKHVGANKEVILSAGVIDSPKLLMLSGIGPSQHLAEHGIVPIVDLPGVGSHLQDHVSVPIYPFAFNPVFGNLDPLTPENIKHYITNATGPLLNRKYYTYIAHGYFPSMTYNDPTWPDLHTFVFQKLVPTEKGTEVEIIIVPEIVRTHQTGTVRLASANPNDDPLIDPHFLEDHIDLRRLVEGIEYLSNLILNSRVMKQYGIRWSNNLQRIPACERFIFPSSAYWACYVKISSYSGAHLTSTCRMGPDASVAVVDSKLRVFGTKGLRVSDASVFPFAPNGNTNFPSIMVGEMGAKIILGQI